MLQTMCDTYDKQLKIRIANNGFTMDRNVRHTANVF